MSSVECEGGGVVELIIGAFFLVRGELFRNLKGFDERFFVYFEELDFSLRTKRLGYSSCLLTEASAYHKKRGVFRLHKGNALILFFTKPLAVWG